MQTEQEKRALERALALYRCGGVSAVREAFYALKYKHENVRPLNRRELRYASALNSVLIGAMIEEVRNGGKSYDTGE